MNPIQNFLQLACERKAHEILFHTHQPLRIRIGQELVDLAPAPMSSQESRLWLAQILSEEERNELFDKMKIRGCKTLGSVSFQFDFQVDFEGINGSISLQNQASYSWQLPQIVNESVMKSQGLNLLVGPRKSGKSTVVQQILGSVNHRRKSISIYSESERADLVSEGNFLVQFPIEHLRQNGVVTNAEVVVIDSSQAEFCETALRLAEEGRSVVLTLSFWNIGMALQRFVDLCEGSVESRARRLSSVLQMAVGLRLLPGLESPLQGVLELLLADSEIQESLRLMNFEKISEVMKRTAEKTGMRSLNHSLFQLLMKRKIEMKAAFEASYEPEELDALLKKVGI